MAYGDYRHLMDQDPQLTSQFDTSAPALGVPAAQRYDAFKHDAFKYDTFKRVSGGYPSAPPPVPGPGADAPARVRYPELYAAELYAAELHAAELHAAGPAILPHQRRMAVHVARDHGRQFKVQLKELFDSGAANVMEVRRLLTWRRPWWSFVLPAPKTVGLVLCLNPTRVVITPEGFFTMARPPQGSVPGRLAPLCSTDFGTLGAPPYFIEQVHAELNSILRRRTEIWRELVEFKKPQKSLHTCRTV